MLPADRIYELMAHQPQIPATNNPAAKEDEYKNDLIRYESVENPTNDECGICLDSLSNGNAVVAHIKKGQPQPLHPFHKTCIRTELRIRENCPICSAPFDSNAHFPMSFKEKLIENCTSLLSIGKTVAKAATIAKIVQMIFTTAFTSEEMFLGFGGAAGVFGGVVLAGEMSVNPINHLIGAVAGGGMGSLSGMLIGKNDEFKRLNALKNLIKKFGMLTGSGIGGIGATIVGLGAAATIGLGAALTVLELAKRRFQSIRQADIYVGHTIKPLPVITGLFGAALVEKVVLKVLNSFI